jgi:hypothetical protein
MFVVLCTLTGKCLLHQEVLDAAVSRAASRSSAAPTHPRLPRLRVPPLCQLLATVCRFGGVGGDDDGGGDGDARTSFVKLCGRVVAASVVRGVVIAAVCDGGDDDARLDAQRVSCRVLPRRGRRSMCVSVVSMWGYGMALAGTCSVVLVALC